MTHRNSHHDTISCHVFFKKQTICFFTVTVLWILTSNNLYSAPVTAGLDRPPTDKQVEMEFLKGSAPQTLPELYNNVWRSEKQNGISTYSVSFDRGKITFSWDSLQTIDIYIASSSNGDFHKIGTVRGKTYMTNDADSFFVFKSGDVTTEPFSYIHSSLGPNVKVFSLNDRQSDIQDYISTIYERTAWDEFGTDRHAILFMPGRYDEVTVHAGYYTSVAGLGYLPTEVEVAKLEIVQHPITGSMLTNFWRTVENFTANSTSLFCVSQATSMRRLNIKGDLLLTTGGWGSGGLIADSHISGTIRARDTAGVERQQQWLTRNTSFNDFMGGQMNMVFVGTEGVLPDLTPAARVTHVDKTGFLREKPFVVFDDQRGYGVFLPAVRNLTVGHSWKNTTTAGEFITLNNFYIARADYDTETTLNGALAAGKHLLFSPGIYYLNTPLIITNPNTIVMGLGLATLCITEKNNDTAIRISDVDGVNVSSLLFEAGPDSKSLMEVGATKTTTRHADNPICLADLFFRNKNTYNNNVRVDKTFIINANDVFGDNFWLWRADHSFTGNLYEETMRFYKNEEGNWTLDGMRTINPETGQSRNNWAWNGGDVGWNSSYGRNGVIVEGDYVTLYGLMVEHYMEYQTIWNGENGLMCFYQSETPYDAPNQETWMRNGGTAEVDQGYASYKIGEHVQNHTTLGVGIYYVSNTPNAVKVLNHAIEAPENPGIIIRNMVIARFAGSAAAGSGIRYIINGHGQSVWNTSEKTYLSSFIGGTVTP